MKVPAWMLPTAVALLIGFFLGGATAIDASLFGQTVAAWVQAIGAVAAIVWGFWLFNADSTRRRLEQEERRAQFGRSFTEIASLLSAQLVGAERLAEGRSLGDHQFTEVTFDRFRFADHLIAGLSAETLAESGLAFEAITARSRIGQARRRCEEYNKLIVEPDSPEKIAALNEIRTSLSRLRQNFQSEEMALRHQFPKASNVTIDAE